MKDTPVVRGWGEGKVNESTEVYGREGKVWSGKVSEDEEEGNV